MDIATGIMTAGMRRILVGVEAGVRVGIINLKSWRLALVSRLAGITVATTMDSGTGIMTAGMRRIRAGVAVGDRAGTIIRTAVIPAKGSVVKDVASGWL
jgi:hypothetical protein